VAKHRKDRHVAVQVDRFALSVDVVCFNIVDGDLHILLMLRNDEPFKGVWALPGGIVHPDEGLDDAGARILEERTGVHDVFMEQLYTFGRPNRDPRGRTVSVAYVALLPLGDYTLHAGRGASDVAWHPLAHLPTLAFDHAEISRYGRLRLALKIDYAPLAFNVLPETFTMGDLRAIHESILDRPLHPSNFVRQMLARWDLAPVTGTKDRRTRRPARLYRYIGPRAIPGAPSHDAGEE